MNFKAFLTVFILSGTALTASSQTLSSDELLQASQAAVRQEKNYPKAISLLKQALEQSPDYADVRIFLGRVYTWNDFPDSARAQFKTVLSKDAGNLEAYSASFDLEYWNDHIPKSLEVAEAGLKIHPNAQELVVRKARALNALDRLPEALRLTANFLKQNPQSADVAAQLQSLKEDNLKNDFTYGYTFSSFDKRFEQPWHLANISYGRETALGSLNFQINYANRFNTNGLEFETAAYPGIAKGLYAYVGAAVSGSSIFSKNRLGLSLYKSLPYSFEAEGGIRYLKFSSATTLYVVGLGRYVGSSFIGLRSYLGPDENALSKSFSLYSRFFFSDDRNDYLGISAGTGFSPDDATRGLYTSNLKSFKTAVEYSRNVSKRLTLSASGSYINEEFRTSTFGNQFTISAGMQQRF